MEGSEIKEGEETLEEKEQKKFFIDYTHDPKQLELVRNLLRQANEKKHGREINLKDLVSIALEKVGKRDLEKIKRLSLSEMDKVQMLLEKYNQQHGTDLNLGEFLAKQLKLS